MHYKGYWSFAPIAEGTSHIVEADSYESAVGQLLAWGCAHQSIVDHPFDFQVRHLDGFDVICTMSDVYYNDAHKHYADICGLLQAYFGSNICFEHCADGLFAIFYAHYGDSERFTADVATAIRDALLDEMAHLFAQINIDEVIYDDAHN